LALGTAWQRKTGKETERHAEAFRFFKEDSYRFMKETSSEKLKKAVSADLKKHGIDEQEIKDLFNAPSVKEAFVKNLADGKRLGIAQYPVLFVNGHYYQGPPDPAKILAAGK
ncbi:MAG: thioredoxin domain-containing protein, partial [Spirochaetia bacterium]|nr:thioredoxin domain-containing protein [Spirochaetia bacterium]